MRIIVIAYCHALKKVRSCGIPVLLALMAGHVFFCNSGKSRSDLAFKAASINAAPAEKESQPVTTRRGDGSLLHITPFPLDSFGMGCACIWWLARDSAANVFFAQNGIDGEHPVIAIDNKKYALNLKFVRLVEKERGVEHVGDSVIQAWESENLLVEFHCVKTFTCQDDPGLKVSDFCEVTKFRGMVRIMRTSDKKERMYPILGDCGC